VNYGKSPEGKEESKVNGALKIWKSTGSNIYIIAGILGNEPRINMLQRLK
jgi:hypothetical protein